MTKKPPGASAAPLGATQQQCTCPSGDGSLRWPCPTHPPLTQQQGGEQEAQSEDMLDPVKIEISIPGELGKTIRFVERKWLYGNDQHHDDAPASARVEAMRTALTEHFTPPRHPADEGNK